MVWELYEPNYSEFNWNTSWVDVNFFINGVKWKQYYWLIRDRNKMKVFAESKLSLIKESTTNVMQSSVKWSNYSLE